MNRLLFLPVPHLSGECPPKFFGAQINLDGDALMEKNICRKIESLVAKRTKKWFGIKTWIEWFCRPRCLWY